MTKVTSLNVQVTRTEMKFDVKSKIEITIHLYIFSNQPLIINYKYIIYDYIEYNLKEAWKNVFVESNLINLSILTQKN